MGVIDAVVVGAGISGLTAAYRLHQTGHSVCVLEAGDRPGGLIQSVQEDGFLMEHGPHTFPGRATELIALCRELGWDPVPTNAWADKRYLYLKSRLTALPRRPEEA